MKKGGADALRKTITRYDIISIYKILYLVCSLLNATAPFHLHSRIAKLNQIFTDNIGWGTTPCMTVAVYHF